MLRLVVWAPVPEEEEEAPPLGAELEKHLAAYRNPERRKASRAAWNLLARELEKQPVTAGELRFESGGKPYFDGNALYFSLSHCESVCAVSLSDAPTGVDVERIRQDYSPRLIERCLSERERADFDGDFTRLWCRKEAVVKLTGEGILSGLNRIETAASPYCFDEQIICRDGVSYQLTAAFCQKG